MTPIGSILDPKISPEQVEQLDKYVAIVVLFVNLYFLIEIIKRQYLKN